MTNVDKMTPTEGPIRLRRHLGLPLLTFYGLGTIVGGGFYALVGRVADEAGMLTPLAFLTAAMIAMFSAFSYAELSARLPYSAGESRYVFEAFKRRWFSATVGWLVICTGIVSAATLATAFAGFLRMFLPLPEAVIVFSMVGGLGLLAAWGIAESVWVATIVTVIEVCGLLFVLVFAGGSLSELPARWRELVPSGNFSDWRGIFLGAYLGFYSFVGFEDMVNVAEEVKRPRRNLPIAILLSLAVTGVLYFSVTLVAVLAVPQELLIVSDAPLSLAVGEWGAAAAILTAVGMLAGLNGALVQIVMASRVAYGMARKHQAPLLFADIHPTRRTPVKATIAATLCVLVLAVCFPLVWLARVTSTILLAVYAIVNLSLVKIKHDESGPKHEGPNYPIWVPIVGSAICLAFLLFHALAMR